MYGDIIYNKILILLNQPFGAKIFEPSKAKPNRPDTPLPTSIPKPGRSYEKMSLVNGGANETYKQSFESTSRYLLSAHSLGPLLTLSSAKVGESVC